ncbi:hypothetical protein [Chromobacterium aquaticum]|uniref:Uncharacterized protein n=1 Tax=Chromobacterium aquaticum TaxID=467180 RepID=A0ABV8ZWX1_9NEIS|nr:hypothetical protein [Chromobacterium aquaticum]MCD5360300.1 hypothetical protein [Chromobacterium aquaticum]
MKSKITYGTIIATAIFILIILFNQNEVAQKDFGTTILSLFSTFIGATFAFRLNEHKETEKLLATQKASMNRALFIIIRQFNAISQIKQDFDNYSDKYNRAFNMPAFKPPSYSDLTHNYSDLEFLLELENAHPNLLLHLTVEQERFFQAMDSISIRNEFYVNEFQIAIEKMSMNGRNFHTDEIKTLLGERLFKGAITGAETAKNLIDASYISLQTLHKEVQDTARSIFPGKKFISYETQDLTNENTDSNQ